MLQSVFAMLLEKVSLCRIYFGMAICWTYF